MLQRAFKGNLGRPGQIDVFGTAPRDSAGEQDTLLIK